MPPVNTLTTASSANITPVCRDNPEPEDPDIWSDAIDYVEMEETWFEGAEAFTPYKDHHTDPSFSAGEAADSRVPFTEDCRRCVQQLVRTLGEYGENKILSVCLSELLPGTPAPLITAANSLYTAVTERRNIDTAALHALGLVSEYLPENMNIVSRLAAIIRNTVTGWTDGTFLQQFLGNDDNHTSVRLFTALAVITIVARHRMKDEGPPQRNVLKVPAFMANIFIRAGHYWTALGNMAGNLSSGAEPAEKTGKLQQPPAFEVDTLAEMSGGVCDAPAPCSSVQRLTAFSSNSTANPEAYTCATVQNRPAPAPGVNTHLSVPEQMHYLAADKLRQESGLSALLYCTNLKTESRRQINEKIITNTYFNMKCEATAYPAPLTKGAHRISVHTGIRETQISSSATSQSGGDTLLPLAAAGAAVAPVATSYVQALKSKTVIAAGTAMGVLGLTAGGKALWDSFSSPESIKNNEIKSDLLKATDMDIQKLCLSGTPKKVFRTYRLISDESGQSKKIQPRKAMNLDLIRLGSEMYKTKDYLTFSLPSQHTVPDVHQIGVVKKIKKGISHITFDLRSDTGHSKCTIFSLRKYNTEDVFKLSKRGKDLIVWDNGNESIRTDFFMDLTQTSKVDVTVNLGLMSFIDININNEHIYTDMTDSTLSEFFAGINCEKTSKYYREVHIKDLTTEHVKPPALLTDWSGFISVAEKNEIKIDRSINPFTEEGIKFYGSKEHLEIIAERKTLFESIYKGRIKRSVSTDASLTTALNAVSFIYLTIILSDPKVDRETKENAILDYVKIASADIFSFSTGLIEHMDPFKLVSGSYAAEVKGILKTAGASVGVIFSALNFIEGVEETDLAKIASASLGILGAISGVVLSGFTGFGFALFLMGGGLILDAISDTKKRGRQREVFFKDTILNVTRNQLYNYAWISKTNQKGESEGSYNEFILSDDNVPGEKQKNEAGEYLFYESLSGHQYITPEKAGSFDNVTYNTSPENENMGFIGFKTHEETKGKRVSHIIYTSDGAIKDTSYIAHNNQGKDSIQGYGDFLNGDDTIYSRSTGAGINAGDGNDIVFVSGSEDVIDGGSGSNTAIIDGLKRKIVLNVFGDGHASVGDTVLKNFGSYILTGRGHEVIVNPNGLSDTIPVFICSGEGHIILRNPVSTNGEAVVLQKGNKLRLPAGKGFTYASIPNSISVGGKTIALQKGFVVSALYD
ncbi:calcium-binding protein [Morganella morganii]|uniref:calcium-binding protein n=1 Tax=Morganella morganii TaxID=582 RepID=UPI00046A68E3|nr:calcium-binding protein [Morganella morganii]